MRCKVGDLAFVINDDPPCKSNIGLIVKVVSRSRRGFGEWNIEPTSPNMLIFCPDDGRVVRYGDTKWAWITMPDADLRPIRDPGDDVPDQSQAWLPPVPTPYLERA